MKTLNRPKIDVKSCFAIPVVIVKFSFFAREFVKKKCHFHSYNRNVDTKLFVIPFPGLYLEIYGTKS